MFSDGLRESNVTTKYFDVNDIYAENNNEYPDGYSDNERSFSPVKNIFLRKLINYLYIT